MAEVEPEEESGGADREPPVNSLTGQVSGQSLQVGTVSGDVLVNGSGSRGVAVAAVVALVLAAAAVTRALTRSTAPTTTATASTSPVPAPVTDVSSSTGQPATTSTTTTANASAAEYVMPFKTWGVPHQFLDLDNANAVEDTGAAWDVDLGCREVEDRSTGCTPGQAAHYDIGANKGVEILGVTSADPRSCPDTGYTTGFLPFVPGDVFCVRTSATVGTVAITSASPTRPATRPTTVRVAVELRRIGR